VYGHVAVLAKKGLYHALVKPVLHPLHPSTIGIFKIIA
jgi:hypothetical protein